MAATTAGGFCLRLHEPVPGLDPFGLFRHPTITLGVDDLDGFVRAAEARLANGTVNTESADPPSHDRGSVGGVLAALLDWRRRSVDMVDLDVDQVSFPNHDRARDTDDQPREIGVGATFHRTYRSGHRRRRTLGRRKRWPRSSADPNRLADSQFAPFTKARGRSGEMAVGDRYVIQLAGPWKGAVEVIEVSPRSFRFATLEGHMESGVIEMRAVEVDDTGRVEFTIESWARSHDRAFDLIYDKIGLGRMLQGEMWAIACDRFADVVGGTPDGSLQVATERHAGQR